MWVGLVFFWAKKIPCLPMTAKPWQKKKKKVVKGKFQRNIFFSWTEKGKRFKRGKQANIVPVLPSGQGKRHVSYTSHVRHMSLVSCSPFKTQRFYSIGCSHTIMGLKHINGPQRYMQREALTWSFHGPPSSHPGEHSVESLGACALRIEGGLDPQARKQVD